MQFNNAIAIVYTMASTVCVVYINYTVNSGAQVPVLLFRDCAFARYGLRGVLINMGYFSTR